MFKKAATHFKTHDPILYGLIKEITPFELETHPYPFIRLTRSIIGQQLSVKAAKTIYAKFEKLFVNNQITPQRLIKIPVEKLRNAGISYQKISYLKDLAEKVEKKEVELGKFTKLSEQEIINELVLIRGIGQWTAEMFLMFTLGRPDIFSYGDLGLQNAIKKAYEFKNRPSLKQMEKLSKKWKPYRTYAARILWASLDNAPK